MANRTNTNGKSGQVDIESGNTCIDSLPFSPAVRRDGKRNKSALARRDISPSSVARFHTKYKRAANGCLLWTGSVMGAGYGQFVLERDEYGHQEHLGAHRVAYVLAKGDIPQGFVVRHTCDTPPCVEPDHLILGVQADNIQDAAVQGRYKFAKPWLQKITDAQVAEILVSVETGAALAQRFGVTKSCISSIRRGLRRKAA